MFLLTLIARDALVVALVRRAATRAAASGDWVVVFVGAFAAAFGPPGVYVEASPTHQPPLTHLLGPSWHMVEHFAFALFAADCAGSMVMHREETAAEALGIRPDAGTILHMPK